MLILAVMGIITDRRSPIREMYNMYNDYAGLFTLETSNYYPLYPILNHPYPLSHSRSKSV